MSEELKTEEKVEDQPVAEEKPKRRTRKKKDEVKVPTTEVEAERVVEEAAKEIDPTLLGDGDHTEESFIAPANALADLAGELVVKDESSFQPAQLTPQPTVNVEDTERGGMTMVGAGRRRATPNQVQEHEPPVFSEETQYDRRGSGSFKIFKDKPFNNVGTGTSKQDIAKRAGRA